MSSVRLMRAFGGNSEKGVVKEKKARNDDFGLVVVVVTVAPVRRNELMDRQTRKRDAEKKRARMATRGGRIVEAPSRSREG